MPDNATCIITGASGFIGRHLVRQLFAQGFNIIGIGRNTNPPEEISRSLSSWISCDLSNPYAAKDILNHTQKIDYFFHLAASVKESNDLFELTNLYQSDLITPLLLAAGLAKQLKHICIFSSTAVYGTSGMGVDESSPINPNGLYGTNKAVLEDSFKYLSGQYSVPLSILRISSVYGPGMPSKNAIPKFISCLRRGECPKIFTDPQARRDYLYVGDLTIAAETVAKTGLSGVYNIASGYPIGLSEVVVFLNKILGTALQPQLFGQSHTQDQKIIIAKAQRELGFRSTHPCIGLQQMIDY